MIWLEQPAARDALQTGGKGAALAAMYQAGLPVPRGFVLSARALEQQLSHLTLVDELEELRRALSRDADWHRQSVMLRARLASARLAPQVEAELLSTFRALRSQGIESVAVRSSAAGEDLPGASFAGQHQSFLGVRDETQLVAAVQSCWLSAWSDRALRYARERGAALPGSRMAIIVQELVAAEAAGTALSADPSESGSVIVNGAWGLGPGAGGRRSGDPARFLAAGSRKPRGRGIPRRRQAARGGYRRRRW